MRNLKFVLLIIFVLSIMGCGSGGRLPTEEPFPSDNPPSTTGTTVDTYVNQDIDYVNPNRGKDDNATGKRDNPFKTISKALEHYRTKKTVTHTINIAGGHYNIENGEIFPIILDENITLVRSDENNLTVDINGSGYYDEYGEYVTIVLNGNNTLKSLNISSVDGIGIVSTKKNNIVQYCTLYNNKIGFMGEGGSTTTIASNFIQNNSESGITLFGNASIYLKYNWIKNNGIGLKMDEESTLFSVSKETTIGDNYKCNFYYNSSKDINLSGIIWDKNISDIKLEETICENGNEIMNIGSGEIFPLEETKKIFENSSPNENNSSSPNNPKNENNSSTPENNSTNEPKDIEEIEPIKKFFNGKNKINILIPKYGEYYNSSKEIKFKHDCDAKYLIMALWEKKPKHVERKGKVQNTADIIWYWHTGMEQKDDDFVVYYNEGKVPNDGNLNPKTHENEESPKKLEKGTYYLTIWAWDEKGLKVTDSSIIFKFYIQKT